jgi:hypothetical protein
VTYLKGRICCSLVLLLAAWPAGARGDGGTVRLSERVGEYQVTVFTSPTPLRAGAVDVSVLVLDAAGEPADVEVVVRLSRPGTALRRRATTEAATNKLLRAAVFDLPDAGRWQVTVSVEGPRGRGERSFEVEAAGPLPRWAEVWPWFAWPAGPVVLFGLHQWLRRRGRSACRVGDRH